MEPKAEKKSDKTAGRHRSATVVSPSRTHKESSRTNGSGASPPESRRRAPTQVSASDLVLAFERKILRADDKDKRLTEAELASLYSKETLKVAPSKRKKGSPLNSLFGGPKDDNRERSDDLDPQGTAPSHDNWSTLDIAKKERRVKSILERRTSMMVDVENMLNSTRPRSRTVADYADDFADPKKTLLVKPSDPEMLLELGDESTTFELQCKLLHIEKRDVEVSPYTQWFANEKHTAWIAHETPLGPIIIAILAEKVLDKGVSTANARVIIKSRDVDEWLFVPSDAEMKEMWKSLLERRPQFEDIKFTKIKKPSLLSSKLVELEELITQRRKIKIGVLRALGGQTNDDQMFSNQSSSDLEEFLQFIGTRIEMSGWGGFAGGLDTSAETRTGKHSFYTEYDEFSIMFHVSTMLPFHEADPQRLERKRHLGNDIVNVIFLEDVEPGQYFDPKWLVTNFTHIFFVISKDKKKTKDTGKTHYHIAVASHAGTQPFGPRIPRPASLPKGDELRAFLLTKFINSERAALEAPAFKERMKKTRETYLKLAIQAVLDAK